MSSPIIQAIAEHGFTDRQARFLALVMRHSGVCVPRQYAQVAGIAQGAKCNAFFGRLIRHGHARAIECVHNRARLYLVHSKLLYHVIGEPSSRYRRPVSPRLALERLMVLDAVLSTPAEVWLTTPAEKAALPLSPELKLPAGPSIGVQADGRMVILYLAPEPWPDAFRSFLRAHATLLERMPYWTLRIVLPRRFAHAHDGYQRVVQEELESPLSGATLAELVRYFEARENCQRTAFDARADAILNRVSRRSAHAASTTCIAGGSSAATRRSGACRQGRSPRLWRVAQDASNRSSCRTPTVISLPWLTSRVRRRARLRRGLSV